MTFPAEDLPDVARSANASSRRGRGRRSMGVRRRVDGFQVGTDATVSESPSKGKRTFVGGFAVVDVPPRVQALEWAAKIAAVERCEPRVPPGSHQCLWRQPVVCGDLSCRRVGCHGLGGHDAVEQADGANVLPMSAGAVGSVQQQAYYRTEAGRISWLRIACSGFIPVE